jgi:hypothetical protein
MANVVVYLPSLQHLQVNAPTGDLPPGLAKKDDLPPGQSKEKKPEKK